MSTTDQTQSTTAAEAPSKPQDASSTPTKAKTPAAARKGRTRGDSQPKSRQPKNVDVAKGVAAAQKAAATTAKTETADKAADKPKGDPDAAKRLAETERVKDALRKANLSPNAELTPEQRARAAKPGKLTGAALRKHIMGETDGNRDGTEKVTGKAAARKVLEAHDGPMKISELSRAAIPHATAMKGKTPEQSIARDVLMDSKRPADQRTFVKVGAGLYDLQARNPQGTAPAQPAADAPAQA